MPAVREVVSSARSAYGAPADDEPSPSSSDARSKENALLGELLLRVSDAEAKRRMAEVAADALSSRVQSLEAELRDTRSRAGGGAGGGASGESFEAADARVRAAEQRAAAADERARQIEERAQKIEERMRSSEHLAGVLEQAARASKEENNRLHGRLSELDGQLRDVERAKQDVLVQSQSTEERTRELDKTLATLRAELEAQRGQRAESDHALAEQREAATRLETRAVVAEGRSSELTAQLQGAQQELAAAKNEQAELRADLETEKRRAGGAEQEVARWVVRAQRVEKDLAARERETFDAQSRSTALGNELDAERAQRSRSDEMAKRLAEQMGRARQVISKLEKHETKIAELRAQALARASSLLLPTAAARSSRPPAPDDAMPLDDSDLDQSFDAIESGTEATALRTREAPPPPPQRILAISTPSDTAPLPSVKRTAQGIALVVDRRRVDEAGKETKEGGSKETAIPALVQAAQAAQAPRSKPEDEDDGPVLTLDEDG